MFVDPEGTSKRVPAPYFWLWPLLLIALVSVVVGLQMGPISSRVAEIGFKQQNMTGEQLEQARSMTHTFTTAGAYFTPIIIGVFLLIIALLVGALYSVQGVKTRFRDMFSILAVCGMIQLVQSIAFLFVLRAKGDDITSAEQLRPSFGLDMFTPDLHGPALAILNFFSLFQIWYIVILVLTLAAFTGSSKTKAFVAATPAWVLPLLLAVLGSLFQK